MSLQHLDQKKAETLWHNCFDLIEKAVDKLTYETIIKNIRPVMRDSQTMELSLINPGKGITLTDMLTPSRTYSTKNGPRRQHADDSQK